MEGSANRRRNTVPAGMHALRRRFAGDASLCTNEKHSSPPYPTPLHLHCRCIQQNSSPKNGRIIHLNEWQADRHAIMT
ncbi:hypothetical protein CEXT_383631 [Caerostris extrusa]|uniref:Uncharacterized protein n=1 Tax=Caerostris extrusa TaxID=172846 RepID=A0AAV4MRA6_CAEEX|nr:hypothetical protein CEXT_383631 [Caerostris extrusa]